MVINSKHVSKIWQVETWLFHITECGKGLLIKKMSKTDLRKEANIALNTMTKLSRDEPVNLVILGRICEVL